MKRLLEREATGALLTDTQVTRPTHEGGRATLTAAGCHIYAGGHTVGVKQAGFDVRLHLEEGSFGAETARRNLGVEVRLNASAEAGDFDLVEWWPRDVGQVDWLFGNPPCAAWSTMSAGTTKVRGEKSDYVGCTERLFALATAARPTVFSWECVTQVLKAGRSYVDRKAAAMRDLGYEVHEVVFDAADCGLPSRRKRFFFVASKVRLEFERPAEPHVTPREAWARTAAAGFDPGPGCIGGEEVKLLKTMPKGRGRVRDYAISVGSSLRPFASNMRLGFDELAPTIAGGAHYYHPEEPRYLTVREQQVLAGYPPDYEFVCSLSQRYLQIGRGVSPPAARWLGRHVAAGLRAGRRARRGEVFRWDFLRKEGGRGAT